MSHQPHTDPHAGGRERIHVSVGGAVQGVGFRPFVYRLAHEEQLAGWVCNTPEGVEIEVEGEADSVEVFLERLSGDAPAHSRLNRCDVRPVEARNETGFQIVESRGAGAASVIVQPDLATCPDCLREIQTPTMRRFRYPFTNCTYCGPRYSIINRLPYDRQFTTMREFKMCPQCEEEYRNPADRRFHAQPIACPACGPQLEFWDTSGHCRAREEGALQLAADALRSGKIVAVKGVGGFHLMVDAQDGQAVARLRLRKRRPDKPLAIMAPGLLEAEVLANVSDLERSLLLSAAAPIVLMVARDESCIAAEVAPGNPMMGIMLPSNPLHHLLMAELGFPVVATSGNISDEPLCTDEAEAYERLHSIADAFLMHNRPIARPLDDSIVRVAAGEPMLLRVGRGYAPIHMPVPGAEPGVIAVGAHQKCTVAVSLKDAVVVGQHLGDQDNVLSINDHRACTQTLQKLYNVKPATVACDLHPDYSTTSFARTMEVPQASAQHHYAHALACAAENNAPLPSLAVTWDGTGYGTDDTSWGGEFLRVRLDGFDRVAHFRPFPLPGGDAASRDPRRSCFGLLHEFAGPDLASAVLHTTGCMTDQEIAILANMVRSGINTPITSSVGRLFDAVAFLVGLRGKCSFEGQAAMDLEFAACSSTRVDPYTLEVRGGRNGRRMIDWGPMVAELLQDVREHRSASTIAIRFHETLARVIVRIARTEAESTVLLTGGCFQNAKLLGRTVVLLRESGIEPRWNKVLPPNDNSISLGQAVAAMGVTPVMSQGERN
jgi:hydrogenase maturation protein HypF